MVLKAFRFPPATWAAVEAACEADGINPSDFVRAAVEAALAARTEAVAIAGEWLRTEQINFDLGLGDVDDLIGAVRADLEGRAARLDAVRAYNVAVLRLLHATGVLAERARNGTLFDPVSAD